MLRFWSSEDELLNVDVLSKTKDGTGANTNPFGISGIQGIVRGTSLPSNTVTHGGTTSSDSSGATEESNTISKFRTDLEIVDTDEGAEDSESENELYYSYNPEVTSQPNDVQSYEEGEGITQRNIEQVSSSQQVVHEDSNQQTDQNNVEPGNDPMLAENNTEKPDDVDQISSSQQVVHKDSNQQTDQNNVEPGNDSTLAENNTEKPDGGLQNELKHINKLIDNEEQVVESTTLLSQFYPKQEQKDNVDQQKLKDESQKMQSEQKSTVVNDIESDDLVQTTPAYTEKGEDGENNAIIFDTEDVEATTLFYWKTPTSEAMKPIKSFMDASTEPTVEIVTMLGTPARVGSATPANVLPDTSNSISSDISTESSVHNNAQATEHPSHVHQDISDSDLKDENKDSISTTQSTKMLSVEATEVIPSTVPITRLYDDELEAETTHTPNENMEIVTESAIMNNDFKIKLSIPLISGNKLLRMDGIDILEAESTTTEHTNGIRNDDAPIMTSDDSSIFQTTEIYNEILDDEAIYEKEDISVSTLPPDFEESETNEDSSVQEMQKTEVNGLEHKNENEKAVPEQDLIHEDIPLGSLTVEVPKIADNAEDNSSPHTTIINSITDEVATAVPESLNNEEEVKGNTVSKKPVMVNSNSSIKSNGENNFVEAEDFDGNNIQESETESSTDSVLYSITDYLFGSNVDEDSYIATDSESEGKPENNGNKLKVIPVIKTTNMGNSAEISDTGISEKKDSAYDENLQQSQMKNEKHNFEQDSDNDSHNLEQSSDDSKDVDQSENTISEHNSEKQTPEESAVTDSAFENNLFTQEENVVESPIDSGIDIFASIIDRWTDVLEEIPEDTHVSVDDLAIDITDILDIKPETHLDVTDENYGKPSAELEVEHRDYLQFSESDGTSDKDAEITTEKILQNQFLQSDILSMAGFLDTSATTQSESPTIQDTTPYLKSIFENQTENPVTIIDVTTIGKREQFLDKRVGEKDATLIEKNEQLSDSSMDKSNSHNDPEGLENVPATTLPSYDIVSREETTLHSLMNKEPIETTNKQLPGNRVGEKDSILVEKNDQLSDNSMDESSSHNDPETLESVPATTLASNDIVFREETTLSSVVNEEPTEATNEQLLNNGVGEKDAILIEKNDHLSDNSMVENSSHDDPERLESIPTTTLTSNDVVLREETTLSSVVNEEPNETINEQILDNRVGEKDTTLTEKNEQLSDNSMDKSNSHDDPVVQESVPTTTLTSYDMVFREETTLHSVVNEETIETINEQLLDKRVGEKDTTLTDKTEQLSDNSMDENNSHDDPERLESVPTTTLTSYDMVFREETTLHSVVNEEPVETINEQLLDNRVSEKDTTLTDKTEQLSDNRMDENNNHDDLERLESVPTTTLTSYGMVFREETTLHSVVNEEPIETINEQHLDNRVGEKDSTLTEKNEQLSNNSMDESNSLYDPVGQEKIPTTTLTSYDMVFKEETTQHFLVNEEPIGTTTTTSKYNNHIPGFVQPGLELTSDIFHAEPLSKDNFMEISNPDIETKHSTKDQLDHPEHDESTGSSDSNSLVMTEATTEHNDENNSTITAFTIPLLVLTNQAMLSNFLHGQINNGGSKVVIKEQGSKVAISSPSQNDVGLPQSLMDNAEISPAEKNNRLYNYKKSAGNDNNHSFIFTSN